LIFATCSQATPMQPGRYVFECLIPADNLNDNVYLIDIMVVENSQKRILNIKEALAIEGVENKRESAWLGKFPGLVRPKNYPWQLKKMN